MVALFFFFLLSILFSFLCSIWEAVLLSITPSYVQSKIEEGGTVGQKLNAFKQDIDKPLSAILTLNTIAHTVGAIGVGAQAGKMFANADAPSVLGFQLNYESMIAAAMTLAILVLSEIIPKTIGANNWRGLAPFTVRSLSILVMVLYPFVWLSQLITKTLKKNKAESVLSRADFAAMARVGAKEGALQENEHRVIRNLLRMEGVRAKDVMTPRTAMIAVSKDITLKEFFEKNPSVPFSRLPVFGKNRDDMLGIALKSDWLSKLALGQGDETMGSLVREVPFVDADMKLPELFETLTKASSHMAILVDEYGGVQGLVTQEDVIETLLGREIIDETDKVEDLQAWAREQWKKRSEARKKK